MTTFYDVFVANANDAVWCVCANANSRSLFPFDKQGQTIQTRRKTNERYTVFLEEVKAEVHLCLYITGAEDVSVL